MDGGDRLRFGIVGCGEIAVRTAASIHEAENAELKVAMDIKPDLAKDLADRYGASYTTELKDVLADPDVDAVYIATPHYLHAPIAMSAARAGKHVMVEKPIATRLEDAEGMIRECRRAGVALSVCFILRYMASSVKAKQLIEEEAIGRIYATEITIKARKPDSYWYGGYTGRAKTSWRTSKEKSGGGILIMNASHNIDLMRYITGLEVRRVYSEYDTFLTPVEVEDFIVCVLRYDNGAIGYIVAGSCMEGSRVSYDSIYGSEGQIQYSNFLKVYTLKNIEGVEPRRWVDIPLTQKRDPRTIYVERFAEAVLDGKKPDITGEDGYEALKIVLAAYKSGIEKKPINL